MKQTDPNKTPIPLSKTRLPKPLRLAWSCSQRLMTLLLAVIGVAGSIQAQTYTVTNLFTIPTGVGVLANSTGLRGMAYDSVSNLVYVASTAPVISAYDGSVSNYLGNFNVTGVSGGSTFNLDQIGVAGDGAIYGINLSTGNNKLYRWTNWTSVPTVAFNANPLVNGTPLSYTSGRVGDTMSVAGSGTNTLILCGVGGKPYFSLFYTTNGLNYTNTIIVVPSGLSLTANVYGIALYTNNTFLVKPASSGSSTAYLIQFPTNYMTQGVVTGAVVSSTSLGSAYAATTFLSYAPSAGFLGVLSPASSSAIGLLGAANIGGGVTLLASTNATTPNSNGNATGGVALGGAGGTNVIYVYDTANSLFAYKIVSIPPLPPTIATAPVGGSFYLSDTLSVAAAGTAPFSYTWRASVSNSATATSFTNIPGATTNTFTVTGTTNYFEVVITNIAGSITSTPVQVTILNPITNAVVTKLWSIAPGATGYSYLGTDNNTRGLGYDTNSGRLLVASTSGSTAIYVLDGNTGTNVSTLSLSGLTLSGQLQLDQVTVADDGAVYAGNLALPNASQYFQLYRWGAPTNTAVPVTAYSDTLTTILFNSGDRWGDSMDSRGAGTNTQIILSSRGGTNVALLVTADGTNFTPSIIAITNVPSGFAANGIYFGSGNTLWGKTVLGDLYEVSYDPVALVGGVVLDYPNPSKTPSYLVGVAVDPIRNLLAGVDLTDSPEDLRFYQLTGTSDAPVLFHQAFFNTANGNGNANAVTVMKYPRAYALNVNNGLVGVTYGVPATTAPTINTPPASQSVYTNTPSVVFSVGASGSVPLYYQWQFSTSTNAGSFTNISGATSSTYTVTNLSFAKAGYYQVVAHNIAGYATSTPPALLTLLVPTTSLVVTQLWTVPAGTYSFLDGSTYNLRGLAYDTNTGTLLLADHTSVHVFTGATGSYLGDLNAAGLPSGGTWAIDQIGVADDGIMYSCNMSTTGAGFAIVAWNSLSVGASASAYSFGGSTGADPSGSGDRWGDTMSVRGSGVNTEIIIGSYNGTNVVVFDTTDGTTFTPHVISVPGVPLGFSGLGIAFGAGNTFWAKGGHNYNLREVSYDKTAGTGTVVQVDLAGSQVPNDLTGLSVDVDYNLLGGVCFNNSPNDFQLYVLSGNTNAPALVNQAFFGSNNANSQENAATTLKGGLGFALDVNNGITAISYGMPSAPAVTITSVGYAPGAVTLNWNNTFNNHTYQVQYKSNLTDASWTSVGTPITATDATASYVDTTAGGNSRFYRVISQ